MDIVFTLYGHVLCKAYQNEFLYAYILGIEIDDILNFIFTRHNDFFKKRYIAVALGEHLSRESG